MGQFGIGQSVSRLEDPRLLTGRGRFLDDGNVINQARGYVLRSPHAHAAITSINADAARNAPGVVLVLTGVDYLNSGLISATPKLPRKRPDGGDHFTSTQPTLATDRVRYVGEAVAFIVAETIDQAKDAAELIEVDFDPLPSITDTGLATDPASPVIWDGRADNICFMHPAGDKAAVDRAFARADHVVSQKFVINRITANSMEGRGCIAEYDPHDDRYVLHAGAQGPHAMRQALATTLGIDPSRIRIIAEDMGGGFGMKGMLYPEFILSVWAAREIGRPVKWLAERSEGILSDNHARDNVTQAELALDGEGKFLALRVRTTVSLGAYYTDDRSTFPACTHIGVLSGTYTTGAIYDEVTCVTTNTNMTAPYRGAGRPEAAYVIERMIDLAAGELDIDRIELRRRNTIPADAMPYKTSFLYTYDSGEFEKNLDTALANADYAGYPDRLAHAKARGRLRGIGITNTIELAQGMPVEQANIRFNAAGGATVTVGTKDSGQGHETMYKMLLSAKLGVDSDLVRFVDGDTDQLAIGSGTFGSRSAFMGGSALYLAADKIIEKGKKIAAHVLESSESDIEFGDGTFTIAGTDRSITLEEVAKTAALPAKLPDGMEPGLMETGTYKASAPTFPNGCHVVEVEIDPDICAVEILRYTVVDDVGVVINPKTLKGQVHGGIVQGAGQVLMEDLVYDPESGQVLTGSFMDYAMPRAEDFCNFDIVANEVPTPTNPLGVKGGGEAGTVGALPAVMNAIIDALAPYGVTHLDLPATPERIWQAISKARDG